jgi:3-oxoacyl-[acyl-carrier protein] reductase
MQTLLLIGCRGAIGTAIMKKYLEQGWFVIGILSNKNNIESYSADIISYNESFKNKFAIYELNLSNFHEVAGQFNAITSRYEKIDAMIYSSGITKDKLAIQMTDEMWLDVLNLNLNACFVCNREMIKKMLKAKSGKIVNIASVIGMTGNIGQANYAASKAGMIAMSKTLALEVAKRNISINTISPGFVSSEMTEKIPQNLKEDILKKIPTGRYGEGNEIANLAFYLTSEQSGYITAQNICINGGMN